MIDVLRASTTIVQALLAGARGVMACETVDEARRLARRFEAGEALLGGERGGLPIEGFDLGNSPSEYTAETVAGKTVIFTTTNGTKALAACDGAKRVFIGSLVNRMAIVTALDDEPAIHLVCAGTRGEISREDLLAAGAMVDRLTVGGAMRRELNDSAMLARDAWRGAIGADFNTRTSAEWQTMLLPILLQTAGGRNLRHIGLEADVAWTARLDAINGVARLDADGLLRLA